MADKPPDSARPPAPFRYEVSAEPVSRRHREEEDPEPEREERDDRGNRKPTVIEVKCGGKRVVVSVFDEEEEAEIRRGRWHVDARGKIVWSNVDKNLLGITWRSVEIPWEYVHPEDVKRVQAEWDRAMRLRKNFTMRFRVRRGTGEYIEVIHRGKPMMCEGEFCGFKGTTEPVE